VEKVYLAIEGFKLPTGVYTVTRTIGTRIYITNSDAREVWVHKSRIRRLPKLTVVRSDNDTKTNLASNEVRLLRGDEKPGNSATHCSTCKTNTPDIVKMGGIVCGVCGVVKGYKND